MMGLTTFLNGGTISQLRGLAWLALSDNGRIGAGSVTDDAGGGATIAWNYGGTIPCRVDPLTDYEQTQAGRINDRSTHLVTVAPYTPITVRNRFQVINGGTFEVTAVNTTTAEPLRTFEVVQIT